MTAIDIQIPAPASHISDDHRQDRRNVWAALKRGMMCKCPACGEGKIYTGYLKVAQSCDACGTELHHHRADDAPPYIVISIVGHALLALLLVVEDRVPGLPLWVHALLWPALALVACLWLLPITKGGLIGVQWALRMHGFEDASRPAQETVIDGRRSASQTAAG